MVSSPSVITGRISCCRCRLTEAVAQGAALKMSVRPNSLRRHSRKVNQVAAATYLRAGCACLAWAAARFDAQSQSHSVRALPARTRHLSATRFTGTFQRSLAPLNHHARIPDAAALFDPDLCGNALFQAFDVADDANHLAAGVQRVERIERDFQRVAVERAEAFVQKQ